MADSGELAELMGVEQPARGATSAKQDLQQADPQQSPPMQIENS